MTRAYAQSEVLDDYYEVDFAVGEFAEQVPVANTQKLLAHRAEALEIFTEADEPLTRWAQKYLDSMFGEGTADSLELKRENAELITGALMRIGFDPKEDEERALYADIVKMALEGHGASQVANANGIDLNKVRYRYIMLKERVVNRLRGQEDGKEALSRAMIEVSENVPLDELPIAFAAREFVDSMFGDGATKSLELKMKDTDLVIGGLMSINDGLPDDKKEIMTGILKLFFEGYSHSEIAETLGMTKRDVKIETHRLREWTKTRISGREIDHNILLDAMLAGDEVTDNDEPVSYLGKEYLDSMFGKGVTESSGVTTKDSDLIIGVLMRLNRDFVKDGETEFYSDALRMLIKGINKIEIAETLGLPRDEVVSKLRGLRRRSAVRLRYQNTDQNLLLEMINKEEVGRLNAPLVVNPQLPQQQTRPYANNDNSFMNTGDEELEQLKTEGLCQQVDPGINTGNYFLNSYEAKQVCSMCHLSAMCLEYALKQPYAPRGIWGGKSERQRNEIRQARIAAENAA